MFFVYFIIPEECFYRLRSFPPTAGNCSLFGVCKWRANGWMGIFTTVQLLMSFQ